MNRISTFISSFLFSLKSLFGLTPRIKQFKWIGKKPYRSLWARMFRLYEIELEPGSTIQLMDYDKIIQSDYITQKDKEHFLIRNQLQKVDKNGEYEEKLLSLSTMKTLPHEVAQIRVLTSQKEQLYSKVFHGTEKNVFNISTMAKTINELQFQAKSKGMAIEEIQINHTHPSLELIITEKEKTKFIINGLSETDIESTKKIAEFCDHPLVIKAITPSGINYSTAC